MLGSLIDSRVAEVFQEFLMAEFLMARTLPTTASDFHILQVLLRSPSLFVFVGLRGAFRVFLV
jgi:hypothetical protein